MQARQEPPSCVDWSLLGQTEIRINMAQGSHTILVALAVLVEMNPWSPMAFRRVAAFYNA